MQNPKLKLLFTNIQWLQCLQQIEFAPPSMNVFVAHIFQVSLGILRKLYIFCLDSDTSI